jgi:OmcA/MtrC family decaheme c-type cytochrome
MGSRRVAELAVLAILCVLGLGSCGGGGGGGGGGEPPPPPIEPPPPITPILAPTADLPGVTLEILALSGGSGPGGKFQPGDVMSVDYEFKRGDGVPIPVPEMNTCRIYVSGPSFNYQVVIPRQNDGRARSTQNANGTWRYTFAFPIPDVYDPPPNDTAAFGPGDGEMAGEPLDDGTYTVGMEGYKLYLIDNVEYRDVANDTYDFLLGNATTIEHREVVKVENCERCHIDVRAHGGNRKDINNCILCHVSGAEDKNEPTVHNGTPGVSVDFRVMIHKIHSGEHLPSVNGVATNQDGSRNYDAPPTPYIVLGNSNSVNDFSHVPFPVWPNLTFPMPRDQGYTALTSSQKAQEDLIRTGVTHCQKCHGDPDGTGPLTAPAQGNLAYDNSSRRACGACHDDIDWAKPYAANLLVMPAQMDDASCTFCHQQTGGTLSPVSGHLHPINDPVVNPGIHFEILSVAEGGMNNVDGTVDPGEKISVTFQMRDDAGNPVTTSGWASMSPAGSVNLAVAGPTNNRNLLLNTSLPLAGVTGSPPYTINIPEVVQLEYVGDSTGAIETFTTSRTPHWAVSGGATTVFARTASAASATASAAIRVAQNYIDLNPGFSIDPATGFAKDKYVVVDDNVPGLEEYLRIQYVDGNRIWFGQLGSTSYHPATRHAHAAGATVQVVTLTTKTVTTQYTLNAPTGQITEVTEFGAGNAVVVSYTTDFVMPAIYPVSINDTTTITETGGEWASLPIESGTYTLGFWASRSFNYLAFGETQSYRNTSVNDSAHVDFLVGSAASLMPGTIISSKENCNACHDTVYAHGGGREGYKTCILCHGSAGGEDRPRYVAPNAPETASLTIEFREMLHKIHMGEELENAATYNIVGFSSAAYPNNYGLNNYAEVVFPAMPDGVKNCEKCHGVGNTSWQVPTDRNHPLQVLPTKSWRVVCGSCHDGSAAEAHIKAQTSPSGVESCSICHGPGEAEDVAIKHKIR